MVVVQPFYCPSSIITAVTRTSRRINSRRSASSHSNANKGFPLFVVAVLLWSLQVSVVEGLASSIKSRAFTGTPNIPNDTDADRPKLILISGCSGTGKSTFGMSVALDQRILKCISTDTLRSVMRSFVTQDISPALHRSSYEPADTEDGATDDCIIKSWKQTCAVLQHSVDELVNEMIERGASIVIEGVSLIPSNELIQRWEESGGVATGVVLQVSDEDAHKSLLIGRGLATGKGEASKLEEFRRIRAIHDEMVRLGREANWSIIEQNLQPDPMEIVASQLWRRGPMAMTTTSMAHQGFSSSSSAPEQQQMTSRSERRSEQYWNPHQENKPTENNSVNGK